MVELKLYKNKKLLPQNNIKTKTKINFRTKIALVNILNYRVSLAVWDHTMLLAIRRKRTHPALTPAGEGWYSIYRPRRDGRLSWPRCLITRGSGIEPKTAGSEVRRPNHCATETPLQHILPAELLYCYHCVVRIPHNSADFCAIFSFYRLNLTVNSFSDFRWLNYDCGLIVLTIFRFHLTNYSYNHEYNWIKLRC